MTKLDYNLQKTLEWCADNGVVFRIKKENGLLVVAAQRENISSEYVIDDTDDPRALGDATWAALFSVKHGTEFQRRFDNFSIPGAGDSTIPEAGG